MRKSKLRKADPDQTLTNRYNDLLRELFRRSGFKTYAEYAEHIQYSPSQVGAVLNDTTPGTEKLFKLAAAAAGLKFADLVCLPEVEVSAQQEKEVTRIFRRLNDAQRDALLSLLQEWDLLVSGSLKGSRQKPR